jgi:hypothetical protein
MEVHMASSSHEADLLQGLVVGIPRLAHVIAEMSTTHMTSSSQKAGVLQAVVAGIPRVAQVIAGVSGERRARALDAAKHSYLQTFRDIDYSQAAAEKWALSIMRRLCFAVQEIRLQTLSKKMDEERGRVSPH